MRYIIQLIIIAVMFFACTSCNTSKNGLFGKKSPHEKYSGSLTNAGLDGTTMGMAWNNAAAKAIEKPLTIQIPYKENGYFASELPSAAGYSFKAKRGERIKLVLELNPKNVNVFTDVWKIEQDGKRNSIVSADSSQLSIEYDVDEDETLQLRLQPELLNSVEYTLTITTAPSLAFPVRSADKPRVSSYWGADRDGGARSHEGIDIFAAKRTPAIAAADGRITRVNQNNLGGKVVFMRPKGKSYSLYYAHLDSQIVKEGDQVKEGEVIGLIGNTGNARTTPPHLHFGIYTSGGAVDPFPFVNQNPPAPKSITAPLKNINGYVRNSNVANVQSATADAASIIKLPANSIMKIVAANADWYKVMIPDGSEGFIRSSAVSTQPVRTLTVKAATALLDKPDSLAAKKTILDPNSTVAISGTFRNFYYIKYESMEGWIRIPNQ